MFYYTIPCINQEIRGLQKKINLKLKNKIRVRRFCKPHSYLVKYLLSKSTSIKIINMTTLTTHEGLARSGIYRIKKNCYKCHRDSNAKQTKTIQKNILYVNVPSQVPTIELLLFFTRYHVCFLVYYFVVCS